MRAWVRTDRLTGLNLTTGDVINAIQSQNVQAAVGRIGARPISNDQQLQLNIQTKGRLATVEEFADIVSAPIRTARCCGSATSRDWSSAPPISIATRGSTAAPRRRSRSTRRPAPMRSTRSRRSRSRSPTSRSSFPEDLAWKITYDPTVFVTDTIHEVQKTLIEAFILVVIVVYLFLGSIRATLIPTFAVPVSLIGTFIALLAVGYSANTVSLLAVVLAIGIVVDDAIVVVENVERVMEEHPELTPGEATKQAMSRDHRADHRDHAGAVVGLCAGRLHPRHFRRTVPAIRRDRRGGDVPLGDQRADLVAGSVRHPAPAASRAAARRDGLCDARHRSCARPLWRRRRAPGAGLGHRHRDGRGRFGRRLCARQVHADGIPAGGRSRRPVRRRAIARRRLGGAHARTSSRSAEDVLKHEEAVAGPHIRRRSELHRQLFAVRTPPSSS